MPRIALVVAMVAAVLVGTSALARTLPFRPIALPEPADDPADAPSSTASSAAPTQRGAAPSENLPTPPSPTPPAEPAIRSDPTPSAEPEDAPATTPPAAPEPVTITYEAEAADLSGFVRLFEVEGASGGDVVGDIGPQEASHVRFPEVTVDTAGEYELTLFYVSAPDRQAMVSINGAEPVVVEFPGLGGANEVGSVSLPVQLTAGPNAVWFGNVDQPAPALDRITVTG